jgi:catechol 2,3-dioxygenase-like lactoylglutathione lyase family enzyme
MPARTYGLSHVALAVRDPERTARFYEEAFGARVYFRSADSVQVQGPGPHDVLAFDRDESRAGSAGGIIHFGFRLIDPADIDEAVAAVIAAGGSLLRRGEFAPGLPYAFMADPDGHEIEIWYE